MIDVGRAEVVAKAGEENESGEACEYGAAPALFVRSGEGDIGTVYVG